MPLRAGVQARLPKPHRHHALDVHCVGGDLRTLLEDISKFAEDLVYDFAHALVCGLRYLHLKGIIHGEVKPPNILSVENGQSKMAPELFDDGGVHSYASNLWALGCVLYECYAGRPPFIGTKLTELVKSILTDPTPSLPGNPSPSFANLVSRLLIKDPKDRIQWSKICTHAFWSIHQQPISPVVLPPQPTFDNMIQQPCPPRTPEDVNLLVLRLSRIAKSSLQRENEYHKIVENDTDVDV
ncbi:hypothetical protein LXL04_027586 [Taraxacum kok-saghyz]